MIILRNLTKTYQMSGQRKCVADNINATFPTGASVALLGRNGAGKSTLLKMIAGTTHPTSGEVLSTGSVSFPVGLASSLHPDLTGAQNTRFVARIYGADTDALMAYVEDFADLGAHFHLPVRSYSSGMRGRLSFGINMGLEFDTYLVDEVTAVGDAAFKRKSRDVFLSRMNDAGAIFVSHSMGTIREMCEAGALLEDGNLHYYEDVEEAIERYLRSLDATLSLPSSPMPNGGARTNFPRNAQMLFGLGLPQTRAEWLGDCLRRHRPCHFAKTREPHYFTTRSGLGGATYDRRAKSVLQLSKRLRIETGSAQRNTVRLLSELSDLMAIHTAPVDGPDRHDAYLEFLLKGRKNQPVICDFTPDHALLSHSDFAEMSAIGAARFVLVLRDPVARLWAEIWASLPARVRTVAACAAKARVLIAEPNTMSAWPAADYARILAALDHAVPPGRIFYLFHESLTDREALIPFCEFLGIPNIPAIKLPPLTPDPEPTLPTDISIGLRSLLADQYEVLQQRFGSSLPVSWDTNQTPCMARA